MGTMIGMAEAASRAGISSRQNALRALRTAGVQLHEIRTTGPKAGSTVIALQVDSDDLERFIRQREEKGVAGRGRPRKNPSPDAAEK